MLSIRPLMHRQGEGTPHIYNNKQPIKKNSSLTSTSVPRRPTPSPHSLLVSVSSASGPRTLESSSTPCPRAASLRPEGAAAWRPVGRSARSDGRRALTPSTILALTIEFEERDQAAPVVLAGQDTTSISAGRLRPCRRWRASRSFRRQPGPARAATIRRQRSIGRGSAKRAAAPLSTFVANAKSPRSDDQISPSTKPRPYSSSKMPSTTPPRAALLTRSRCGNATRLLRVEGSDFQTDTRCTAERRDELSPSHCFPSSSEHAAFGF